MMGLTPVQQVAHALEDACGLLRRSPDRRTDGAAALLVSGGGLLVDLVRQAASEQDPATAAPFVERVRRWIEEADPVPMAGTQPERRQTDRRGGR